ncbi:MAG: hypothetical protein WD824_24550 [Cyclobacteriaceae bacterium]
MNKWKDEGAKDPGQKKHAQKPEARFFPQEQNIESQDHEQPQVGFNDVI